MNPAMQRIHYKYQVLFSVKNNEKICMNVVCSVVIDALTVKEFENYMFNKIYMLNQENMNIGLFNHT